MTSRPTPPLRVVLAEWQTDEAFLQALTTPATLIAAPSRREEDIAPLLAGADVLFSGRFTPAMAAHADRLRLIQTPGAGTNLIHLDAMPDGVALCNVYGHERAIAEYVVMTISALNRDLIGMNQRLRSGDWSDHAAGPQRELRGRTLAVIGLGRIGAEVARTAAFFGMTVTAVTRTPNPARAQDLGLAFVGGPADLHPVLAEADFVIVAVPLDVDTQGLIGRAEFGAMKSSAYLVNVARGDVVNEADLYDALRTGTIAGAAIDVWYRYPDAAESCLPSRFPFHELGNVIMTPHIAGATDGTFRYRWQVINENLRRLTTGEPLLNVVATSGREAH